MLVPEANWIDTVAGMSEGNTTLKIQSASMGKFS